MLLLSIDYFGLKTMRAPTDVDRHDLIAKCCEQAATIVTSNLDLTKGAKDLPANRLPASASLTGSATTTGTAPTAASAACLPCPDSVRQETTS